jgi:hypothetical protein
MSQSISMLVEPRDDTPISPAALGYVAESARGDMFDMVVRNCIEAGVPRGAIARRLGKDPAQVTRLLSAPGNWTIDTVAELLFAIDGRMLKVDSYWPMREVAANLREPLCLQKVWERRYATKESIVTVKQSTAKGKSGENAQPVGRLTMEFVNG